MNKPQDERVGLSHTIVRDNLVSFTNIGILISDFANKTFILENEFQNVKKPIIDWGAQTILRGNKVFSIDEKGEHREAIPDAVNPRKIKPYNPPEFKLPKGAMNSPLYHTVVQLKVFVSIHPYAIYTDVYSEEAQRKCQENLRKLFSFIERYEKKHHKLPGAVFFPEHPLTDPNSIVVILSKEARQFFLCPTCGSDLHQLGLNYVWNEKLSGKRLNEIKEPSKTWLMMEFVGTHDWMTVNHYCGHRGWVNILYADGSVRWSRPLGLERWNKNAPMLPSSNPNPYNPEGSMNSK